MDVGKMLTRRRKSGSDQTRVMIAGRIDGSGSTARISASGKAFAMTCVVRPGAGADIDHRVSRRLQTFQGLGNLRINRAMLFAGHRIVKLSRDRITAHQKVDVSPMPTIRPRPSDAPSTPGPYKTPLISCFSSRRFRANTKPSTLPKAAPMRKSTLW